MDFSSITSALGLGGEFSTPVGALIEQATSESLINTDWALNLQICDEINQRADGPSHAAKALKRRLKSDNPKILQLTLTLCEAAIKNCSRPLHQALGSREFLQDVVSLCQKGYSFEVRSQALKCVQDWGIAFQSDMSVAYSETYGHVKTHLQPATLVAVLGAIELSARADEWLQDPNRITVGLRSLLNVPPTLFRARGANCVFARLKAQGARFPDARDATPVFTPTAESYGASASGGGAGGGGGGGGGGGVAETTPQTMEKLEEDLQMVKDKITLCREMLPQTAGVDKDPAFSEVVGFLEACRPRMVDLVEAGVTGALGEDTFAKCLQINDALLRTLEAERAGKPIPVEDDDTSAGAAGGAPLLDLGGGSEDPLAGKMSTFSIGDDGDDFAQLRQGKPPAAVTKSASGNVTKLGAVPLKSPGPPKASPTAAADDDLDDFLNSLTDETGPPAAAGGGAAEGANDVNVEDLDKMLG